MATPTKQQSQQLTKNVESKVHGESKTQQTVGAEPMPLLPLISIRPLTIESHRPCMDCGVPASHVVQSYSFRKILCAKHTQSIAQEFIDEAKRVAEAKTK
jgi:hypothetical protein